MACLPTSHAPFHCAQLYNTDISYHTTTRHNLRQNCATGWGGIVPLVESVLRCIMHLHSSPMCSILKQCKVMSYSIHITLTYCVAHNTWNLYLVWIIYCSLRKYTLVHMKSWLCTVQCFNCYPRDHIVIYLYCTCKKFVA